MIYTYKQCIEKYKTDFLLKKELKNRHLFHIDKGIYSDNEYVPREVILMAKYPNAVLTGKSAFYYYDLSTEIPDNYTLATKRNDTRIKETDVEQVFVNNNVFNLGICEINSNNNSVHIYDQERMLIELIRFRSRIPFDYYKEVIGNYRKRINKLDFVKLEEYASKFRNRSQIMNIIQMEVL